MFIHDNILYDIFFYIIFFFTTTTTTTVLKWPLSTLDLIIGLRFARSSGLESGASAHFSRNHWYGLASLGQIVIKGWCKCCSSNHLGKGFLPWGCSGTNLSVLSGMVLKPMSHNDCLKPPSHTKF